LDVLSENRHDNGLLYYEDKLFNGLVKWGEHQVTSRGDETSAEATRAELTDLLPLIRFRKFTSKDFSTLCTMDCSSVLSKSEKEAISKCLSSGKALDMPLGFSSLTVGDIPMVCNSTEDEMSNIAAGVNFISIELQLHLAHELQQFFDTYNKAQ
jgi:hypothetical protein